MTNPNMPDQPTASTESGAIHKQVKQVVSVVPRKSERFDAFLSHNSQDKPDVEKIREKLQAAGIKVWIDRNELSGGDALPTTLKRALENSAACVVFIGAHGVGPWQEKEIAAADKLKRPKRRMIPVFLPGAARELPASLKEKELLWIEFRDFDDQLALDKLIKDIRTKVKDQSWWDRARRILIAAGVVFPLLGISWATKEFCTFQAEFAPRDDNNQRQEIVITRRIDPFWGLWRFQQGTWIFKNKDELEDLAENKINSRLALNIGSSPDWSPLKNILTSSRLGLAELEWLDGPLSVPPVFSQIEAELFLEQVEPERVNNALVLLLKDQASAVRSRAAAILGRLGKSDRNVTESLVALLDDQVGEVRLRAVKSLTQLGKCDANVTKSLFALLKDQSEDIRLRAAELLGELGKDDANIIDALVAFIKDPDGLIPASFAPWGVEKIDTRDGAAEILVQLGKGGVNITKSVVPLFKDPDPDVRSKAVEILGQLGKSDVDVIEAISARLKDDNSWVRYSAAMSLVHLGKGDANVIETLVALIMDQISDVRMNAARALGLLGRSDPNVIRALVASLNDPESWVRACAAESLGQLGKCDDDVIDALRRLLKDFDEEVRTRAAASLVRLGKEDADVIKVLVALLKNVIPYFRSTAAESFKHLVSKSAIEALVALLNDKDKETRSIAAATLVQMRQSDVIIIETLVELLKDQDGNIRDRATDSLVQLGKNNPKVNQLLVELLKENDSGIRSIAAATLVQLGNKDANVTQSLVELLWNQDHHVRCRAVLTLGLLGDCEELIIGRLAARLKDEDSTVRNGAVHAIGNLAQGRSEWNDERMIADLADNDSSVRERAGIVLAYRRQKVDSELPSDDVQYLKNIRDQVERLRKDPRPWVKQASLHALYHIAKRKLELETTAQSSKESQK